MGGLGEVVRVVFDRGFEAVLEVSRVQVGIAGGAGWGVDSARMAFTAYQGGEFAFETVAVASLPEFARRAIAAGRLPCAYVRASWCPANVQLEKSLGDPRMEQALRGVAVAVFDVTSGVEDVLAAGLDARSVPVFFVLDGDGKPMEARITGAAWGENTPENMAPPLAEFFAEARRERARVSSVPAERGAYAAPVPAEKAGRSRLGVVVLVIVVVLAIVGAAWLRVSASEATRKEREEAEQRERIRREIDASIQEAMKK